MKLEILEHIEVIGENKNRTIEVNLVQINDREPVLDIRSFIKEGHVPAGGIWLKPEQVENLRDVLNQITLMPEKAAEGELYDIERN